MYLDPSTMGSSARQAEIRDLAVKFVVQSLFMRDV